ncbi:MAG: type II toxin-antitoxin system VapC family toxin [Propionibacteriaceae bacterium]|nr:type II toxin-antitoxin system VapC family toxin [Propionibacteriaceae bacterium]
MIGLDTNVLVRVMVRDDAHQARLADARLLSLTTANPGYVTHIVLVELWWVLTRSYGYTPAEALIPLNRLTETATIVIQDRDRVVTALDAVRDQGADFADALIVSVSAANGCRTVETFDKAAVRRAGMTPLAEPAPGT